MNQVAQATYAICVKNDGYPASLEVRKVYQVLTDEWAAQHGLVRVIDESSDDYLYSHDYFVAIELPEAVLDAFSKSD